MWLAYQAHVATEAWKMAASGADETTRLHGEVHPPYDPRSLLYRTDGQVFSDAGIPVVVMMAQGDDPERGRGLAAIAIETVARVAGEARG
jgi:hypothetical protein